MSGSDMPRRLLSCLAIMFTLGCAAFNLYLSALCFWIQRR